MADMTVPTPGWKTSEFWLSLGATLLSQLYASGALTNDIALRIAGIAATVLTALGYTVMRSQVKAAHALAAPRLPQAGFIRVGMLAAVTSATIALLIGCSWFRGTVEPDASAAFDCAKTEATAANIADVIATFVTAVAAGTVAQATESLAEKYGAPIVACTLAEIESRGVGSGTAPATATMDPVAIAAAQQLQLHGWHIK